MHHNHPPENYHVSIRIMLGLLFVIAFLSVVGRVLVHNVDYLGREIEKELADYGITGARLKSIEGGWQGFQPVFSVLDASLSLPGRSDALRINQLTLSVDLFSSLLHRDLKITSLDGQIEKIVLVRDRQKHWSLNEIVLNSGNDTGTLLSLHALFHRLPGYVHLNVRLLQIIDRLNNQEHLVQHVELVSERDVKQSAASLRARLPEELGGDLVVSMTGTALELEAYLEVANANPLALSELAGFELPALHRARLDLRVWADLANLLPTSLVLDARVNGLQLTDATLPPVDFRLIQQARQHDGVWRSHAEIRGLQSREKNYQDFDLAAYWTPSDNHGGLWVERVDLRQWQELTAALDWPQAARQWRDRLVPGGNLHQLVVDFDGHQAAASAVGFKFSGFNSAASGSLPGILGLDGRLVFSAGQGRVDLASDHLAVDFGRLFRLPLRFDQVTASGHFSTSDDEWYVQVDELDLVNSDIRLQGRALLEITGQGDPFLMLRAHYQDGKAGSTSRYLPVGIMPAKTVVWLDQGIRQGHIERGDLLFHGRLQRLDRLQREQSGVFHALFDVSEPRVEPGFGWPVVTSGTGRASFYNTSMDLVFDNPKLDQLVVENVRVGIPNLMRSELMIDASTTSSLPQLLSTLGQVPHLTSIRQLAEQTGHVNGQARTETSVLIPLHADPEARARVSARVDLQSVDWHFPQWAVQFNALKGLLKIEDSRVSAAALKGRFFDDPVDLRIDTDSAEQRYQVSMLGDITSARLTRLLPEWIGGQVNGRSAWRVVAWIPQQSGPVQLKASSDLRGSQLSLPAPLDLASESAEALDVAIHLDAGQIEFNLSLASRLQAWGKLDSRAPDPLQALQLRFGYASTTGVLQPGIRLLGKLGELDVDGWKRLFDQPQPDSDQQSLWSRLNAIELDVGRLHLSGRIVPDVRLELVGTRDGLDGSIKSRFATGRLKLPYQPGPRAPFTASLDRLHLDELEKPVESVEQQPEVEAMPNLDISAATLRINDMEFSDLELKTRVSGDLFLLDQLELARDQVKLKASGSWQQTRSSGEHVSVLNVNVVGDDLGQAISSLGLGDSIQDGKVSFNSQVGWSGSMLDLDWPSLIGEASLRITDGYLLDVKPGAGQFIFGFLSINALLRKLTGDLEGLRNDRTAFNWIKGKFDIRGNILTTLDAALDSESARVKLSGSTNLQEKTYDQVMTVVPKVREALPVIGGLAVSPSVGWGLLLLQQIFREPIEKSVEIQYKVSGTWDDPQIVLIEKPKDDVDSEDGPE
jgi:uncharacterized protein (TIGR02099 family)